MAFPTNPSVGDIYLNLEAFIEYEWNGVLWEACTPVPAPVDILWAGGARGLGGTQNNNIWDHDTADIIVDLGEAVLFHSVMMVATTEQENQVFYSTTAGNSWEVAQPPLLNSGAVDGEGAPNRVGVSSSGKTIVGFTSGHLAKSADLCETWVAGPQLSTDSIKSITAIGTTWFIFYNDTTCWRSENDGETWTQLPDGLIGDVGWGVKWFQCVRSGETEDHLMAGGAVGYAAQSFDNGETWSWLAPKGLESGNAVQPIYAMVYCGNDVWMSMQHGGYASRSLDNGVTWEPMERFLNSGSDNTAAMTIFDACADDKGRVLSVHDDAFASYTKDYGETWVRLNRGLNSNATSDFLTATIQNGIWYVTGRSGYNSRCIPLLFPE